MSIITELTFLQVIVNIMRPILMFIISGHKELHKIPEQYIYTIYNYIALARKRKQTSHINVWILKENKDYLRKIKENIWKYCSSYEIEPQGFRQ